MFGRDWGGVDTLVVVLLVLMGASGALILSESRDRNQGSATYSDNGAQQDEHPSHRPIADGGAPFGGAVQIYARNPVAADDERYAECRLQDIQNCDLAAQRSMAVATRWMNYAAWAGLILTLIGLALLWRTMIYTKQAAKHSKEAVDAANRTTTEATKIGEAQVRAYLSISKAEFTVTPDAFILELGVRNYGHSPAKWCSVHARIAIPDPGWERGKGPRIVRSPSREGETSFIAVGDTDPSEVTIFWLHGDIGSDLHQILNETALYFSIDGIMEWIDVFSQRQRLPFFLLHRSTNIDMNAAGGPVRQGTMRVVNASARDEAVEQQRPDDLKE